MAASAGNGIYVMSQYIPNPNFNPAHQVASPCQGPSFLKKFIEGEPKTLGAIQIMIGILQICLGVYLLVNPLSRYPILVVSGVTFWASIFYIISGALSVDAEKKGTRGLVKGSLGMNIVSTIFAGIEIFIVSIDMRVDSAISCQYEFCSIRQGFSSLLSILLLILSVLEFCMAFSTSVFGCNSVCCTGNTAETQYSAFLIMIDLTELKCRELGGEIGEETASTCGAAQLPSAYWERSGTAYRNASAIHSVIYNRSTTIQWQGTRTRITNSA